MVKLEVKTKRQGMKVGVQTGYGGLSRLYILNVGPHGFLDVMLTREEAMVVGQSLIAAAENALYAEDMGSKS